MTKSRSIPGRILFAAAAVLVTVVAVLLVVRGLRALRAAPAEPAAGGEEAVAPAATRPGGDPRTEDAAQWGWFSGAAGSTTEPAAPARNLQRLSGVAGSPFDSAYARREANRLGLRLEGVGRGREAMALVSGRVLRIGDRVADYELVAIDRSGVTLVGASGIRLDLMLQDQRAAPAGAAAGAGATASSWAPGAGGARAAGASGAPGTGQPVSSGDGLQPRHYLPDGRLDFAPTDPTSIVMQREREKGLPYDRFKPWPHGPWPQPPAAYFERDVRRKQKRPD